MRGGGGRRRKKIDVIKSITYVFNVFTSGFLFTTGTADFVFFIIVIAGFVVSLVVFVVFTFWVVIVNGFFAARVVRRTCTCRLLLRTLRNRRGFGNVVCFVALVKLAR
jgi:hypothetical protein